MNRVLTTVAVRALSYLTFIDRMQRHPGDSVVDITRFWFMVRGVAINTGKVGAIDTHVDVKFTRCGDHVG